MSIVMAVKTGKKVIMMADSAESADEHISVLTEPERRKILVLGDVLVGSVGSVKCIRRLVDHPDWFDTKGEPFDKRFIVENIVPKLYSELEQYEFLEERDGEMYNNAFFLLAHKNKLFYLNNRFAVYEVDHGFAVGCTDNLVDPMIKNVEKGKEVETMLAAARLSDELSSGIRPPYYYADTESKEYTFVKE